MMKERQLSASAPSTPQRAPRKTPQISRAQAKSTMIVRGCSDPEAVHREGKGKRKRAGEMKTQNLDGLAVKYPPTAR